MSILKIPVLYQGQNGEKIIYTLFDSGANMSCINPENIQDLAAPIIIGKPQRLLTASKGHFIEVKAKVLLEFYINDIRLSDEFLVVPGLSEEIVIGAATMQKWRMKLDFEKEEVYVRPDAGRMQIIRLRVA